MGMDPLSNSVRNYLDTHLPVPPPSSPEAIVESACKNISFCAPSPPHQTPQRITFSVALPRIDFGTPPDVDWCDDEFNDFDAPF